MHPLTTRFPKALASGGVCLVGTALTAGLLTACSGGSTATSTPTTTTGFVSRADQVVADLSQGNFPAVETTFDATMHASLPLAALQNSWTSYQALLGPYARHGAPTSVPKGQLEVERVPTTMAHGQGEIRITFNPDGTTAGLFFLKAGAPPP